VTERLALELRPWVEDDAPALGQAIAESADHLRPWMAWIADEPLGDAARRLWIRRTAEQRAGGGDDVFGIWMDGKVVGGCGFHRRIGPGGLEIGYWVHAGYLRRGVATEAVRQLCERAFATPSIDRVEIHHDRANVASGAVPAGLGFTLVAEAPEAPKTPAEEGIERVWRLTRAEWQARRSEL
jgi:RimJ/RimL family protein N-acetyltransferase